MAQARSVSFVLGLRGVVAEGKAHVRRQTAPAKKGAAGHACQRDQELRRLGKLRKARPTRAGVISGPRGKACAGVMGTAGWTGWRLRESGHVVRSVRCKPFSKESSAGLAIKPFWSKADGKVLSVGGEAVADFPKE